MRKPGMDSDRDDTSSKLAQMAGIFNLLGTDCKNNIQIIVEQTCRILNGACSLYNRIDDSRTDLVVWAGHGKPDDLEDRFPKEGHICWEATIKGRNKPVVLPDLEATPYFTSDPSVQKYRLKSYLGFPVLMNNAAIGSLCIVDTRKRNFSADEIHVIQTLASALSLEEQRMGEKERYRTLVESSNDAIYIFQNGRFKFVNPRAAEMTGYSCNAICDLALSKLVHPEDIEMIARNHTRRLSGEKFQSTYSFRILDKNQNTLWVQINAIRIIWEGQPAVLGCLRDITRLKELENKLQRAEKMELIGTMAGGVAHDLNNILSGIVSYPELVLMQLPKGSPLKEPISFIHDAGLKAADIVQDLLTLARRGLPIKKIIQLNNSIHDYFNSPAYKRLEKNHPGVRFLLDIEADLLNICGSPSHISKIIMNLVHNAAEAINGNGIVEVKTYNRYVDNSLNGYDRILEGDYVVLSVSDDGDGVSPKDMDRIFDPFYTKKQMGRSGSGLGLSVVWNCVKDHQGYIQIHSAEKKGTTFEIFFPATREHNEGPPEDFTMEKYKGNRETILVVDDAKEQRKIARDALQLLGYLPFMAASGEKAIAFIQKEPVDLILLDMKMEPGIDGLETYRQIIEIHPGQKAVIASGLPENEQVKKTLQLGAGQYIQKPYTLKNLAKALARELRT